MNQTKSTSYCNPVVSKLCSADSKGSVTGYQGIRGYISVMAALKFPYFFIKGTMFCIKIIAEVLQFKEP